VLLLSLFVPESAEPVVAIAASLVLIKAHLYNRHLLRTIN